MVLSHNNVSRLKVKPWKDLIKLSIVCMYVCVRACVSACMYMYVVCIIIVFKWTYWLLFTLIFHCVYPFYADYKNLAGRPDSALPDSIGQLRVWRPPKVTTVQLSGFSASTDVSDVKSKVTAWLQDNDMAATCAIDDDKQHQTLNISFKSERGENSMSLYCVYNVDYEDLTMSIQIFWTVIQILGTLTFC